MSETHHDDHDLGLQQDMLAIAAQLQARRRLLGMMMSAAFVTGCGGSGGSGGGASSSSSSSTSSGSSSSNSSSAASSAASSSSAGSTSCVEYSRETNGPYPSDGSNSANGSLSNVLTQSGVVRSDIRSSFGSSTTTAPGIPLTLTITLANSNNLCSVLPGAAIYIWHCTRDGNYSLYSSGLTGENYLRGVQVADSNGQVTFTTIFPGCYTGRYPHIHLEVFRSQSLAIAGSQSSLISQITMPNADCRTVYTNATGYSSSLTAFNNTSIATDNVFSDNSSAQIAAQTMSLTGSIAAGYVGNITIGVPLS